MIPTFRPHRVEARRTKQQVSDPQTPYFFRSK